MSRPNKTRAEAVVEALFEIIEDTFYDEDAMQIDTSHALDELMRNHGVVSGKDGYAYRGDDKEVPKAWLALVVYVEKILDGAS